MPTKISFAFVTIEGMQIIADLHIHSKYSRAVSQQMNLEQISLWASKKGVDLVATGDWTHPLWFREISANLKEVQNGVFALKKKSIEQKNDAYFILSLEISSIYSQGGKTRRVHNVILSPSLSTTGKVIKELQRRGTNLMSDGRPITGISSYNLLEMFLSIDENILMIPAHIWTPWFSLFGSMSGFDSIDECFGNLSRYIYGVETGLSSDPIMNWQIKELENRSILSSSDAHSGPKLGREATVFVPNTNSKFQIPASAEASAGKPNSKFSYVDIVDAIKQKPEGKLKIGYTIEFFPEEGKYHYTGHRACGIKYSAKETKEKGVMCPVCKKPLTVGVEHRVLDLSEKLLSGEDLSLAKNKVGVTFVSDKEKRRRPFVSMIPLLEILTEITGSPAKALREYERLILTSTEFDILLKKSYEEIETLGGPQLKKAIEIVRDRKAYVEPGYDGVFGTVKIFNPQNESKPEDGEREKKEQLGLF